MVDEDHQERQQPVLVLMGVSGSGKSTVAGIVAGTFTGCGPPEMIQNILTERLGDLDVPMIAWANVGHGGQFQAFPYGIAAELDARVGGVLSDRALDQFHRAIAELRAALPRRGP